MAIPGAGEITPGMNTQARNPAFQQTDMTQGVTNKNMPMQDGAIPIQPAPMKKPESIREYLQALQPGQTPMFTNVPGSTMAQDPNAMAFQGDISSSGQFTPMGEQGAIPEQSAGDPADQPVVGNDPYQMAKQRLPHMLDSLKEEFDLKYGNNTSLEEYDQLWGQAVNHLNNELIKKYEKKIEKSEKQALEWVGKFTKGSIKDWQRTGDIGVLREAIDVQKIAADAKKDYDKWAIDAEGENEFDPKVITARAMLKKYPDVNSYVNSSVEGISKAIEDHAMRQVEQDRARRGDPRSVKKAGEKPADNKAGQPIIPEEPEVPQDTQSVMGGRATPVSQIPTDKEKVDAKVERARARVTQLKKSGYSKNAARKIIRNEFRDLVDLGLI